MAQRASDWWHALVACPYCGNNGLSWPSYTEQAGKCEECGKTFKLDNNILRWDRIGRTAKKKLLSVFLRRLRSFLHPVSSPLLPFRYLAQIRLEGFYRRTLTDLDFARKWADHYLSGLNLPDDAVVLDFGCGRGRNAGMLNQLGYRVVGQDINAHSWWYKITGAGFQEIKESPSLPLCDAKFDLVVEVMVLHYIHETQLLKHVQEMKRILKPGGYWLLLEGNSKSLGVRETRRQIGQLHELDKIKELTMSSGFIEIGQSFEDFFAPHFPIVVDFIRKSCSPRQFDVSGYDSWLAKNTRPERRFLWLLILKRPDK